MFTVFCLVWLTYRLTKKIIGYTYKQELKKELKKALEIRAAECHNKVALSELEKESEEKPE